MWSTGQLTKFSDAMFTDESTDLFMIPTSEVPLTALHGDEILDADGCRCLYARIRRAFAKRQAPQAKTRAASFACTSSTRSNSFG